LLVLVVQLGLLELAVTKEEMAPILNLHQLLRLEAVAVAVGIQVDSMVVQAVVQVAM
jgi:hypothetical protein